MDNLGDILASLDESDMENIKALAKGLFSGEGGKDAPGDMGLSSLGSLLGGGEDERCQLIRALKPMLSEARQKKADDAIKLLRLASALPLLKQSGILDSFLEGFNE